MSGQQHVDKSKFEILKYHFTCNKENKHFILLICYGQSIHNKEKYCNYYILVLYSYFISYNDPWNSEHQNGCQIILQN